MSRSAAMYIMPGARLQNETELRDALIVAEYDDARERGQAFTRDELLAFVEASLAAVIRADAGGAA
jgi:hypothetical protein